MAEKDPAFRRFKNLFAIRSFSESGDARAVQSDILSFLRLLQMDMAPAACWVPATGINSVSIFLRSVC